MLLYVKYKAEKAPDEPNLEPQINPLLSLDTCATNIQYLIKYATMALRRRLLASIVDHAAEADPERLFAVIPKGSELSDGFQNLTMKGLSQAVNFLCRWIEKTIGTGGPRETLAYMGSNDVRYCVFILACQKTGHQV